LAVLFGGVENISRSDEGEDVPSSLWLTGYPIGGTHVQ